MPRVVAITRCKCDWGKFHGNLPLLTTLPLPLKTRGILFSSVREPMLHTAETWPMTVKHLKGLCQKDRAMIHWICRVKPSDAPDINVLRAKLGLRVVKVLVRQHCLRWLWTCYVVLWCD